MMPKILHNRLTVMALALLTMLMASCEEIGQAVSFEVKPQYVQVPSSKGDMFITVKCEGEWNLSLRAYSGETTDWAKLTVTEGTGDMSNVRFIYEANDTGKDRVLTLVLSSGDLWTTIKITQLSGELPGNQDGDGTGEGNDTPGESSPLGWMELPDMSDPELGYYTHWFTYPNDGKKYRNYSFAWSQKDLVSIWVAYPLCKFYTNNQTNRQNTWAYDPLLGKEYSSAPFGGYGGSYARGHQLPSADRLCCAEANQQTFYGTNLTPQMNAHNEGIWQSLESKVRVIANNSDTTYVVTGCMVEGSTNTTVDSDGKKMTIPKAYFKALLRYGKSSTIGEWTSAAYYLEHKSYPKVDGGYDLKAVSMSVDRLEEMTGIDFFVNLPAKVGEDQAARVEAQDPKNSSMWW